MSFESQLQAEAARAYELFARLGETSASDTATRERIFSELKAELERHASLEEEHLFPILRRTEAAQDSLAEAVKDNGELRAKLAALEALPKSDAAFLERVKELRKTFRQHARNEKHELLPAAERARSEQQVQNATAAAEQVQQERRAERQRDGQAEQRASAERARIGQEQVQRAAAEQARARMEHVAAEQTAIERAVERLDRQVAPVVAVVENTLAPVVANIQPVRRPDAAVPHAVNRAPDVFAGAMTQAWLEWVGKASLTGMQISQELLSQAAERQWRFAAEAMRGWVEQNARVMQATMDMLTKLTARR
jgi:hypothetical protein